VLYGTDPTNAHSVNASVTDGDAVSQGLIKPKFASATTTPVSPEKLPGVVAGPTTLTDTFSKTLFQQYLSTRGNTPPTQAEIVKFVEDGVQKLHQSQVVPDAYNLGQVRVSGSGSDALLAYSSAVEAVLTRHTVKQDRSEILYLTDAVEKGDSSALKKIAEIGKAYTAIAQELITVPVPKEAAVGHLALANALAHLGDVITDLSVFSSDPLRTMVALGDYPEEVDALAHAFSNLLVVYNAENVSIERGTPGSHFYASLLLASGSQATSTP